MPRRRTKSLSIPCWCKLPTRPHVINWIWTARIVEYCREKYALMIVMSWIFKEHWVQRLNMLSEYQDLIDELNHMPLTSETLRTRNRQIEIEKELRKLDQTIQIFSRSRVYVKNEDWGLDLRTYDGHNMYRIYVKKFIFFLYWRNALIVIVIRFRLYICCVILLFFWHRNLKKKNMDFFSIYKYIFDFL